MCTGNRDRRMMPQDDKSLHGLWQRALKPNFIYDSVVQHHGFSVIKHTIILRSNFLQP
jgi:hypothetical protein